MSLPMTFLPVSNNIANANCKKTIAFVFSFSAMSLCFPRSLLQSKFLPDSPSSRCTGVAHLTGMQLGRYTVSAKQLLDNFKSESTG